LCFTIQANPKFEFNELKLVYEEIHSETQTNLETTWNSILNRCDVSKSELYSALKAGASKRYLYNENGDMFQK